MNSASDMRIPVLFGGGGEAGDAFLAEGAAELPPDRHAARFTLPGATGHIAGCFCCSPRGPAAEALGRLFRARSTGASPFFSRLIIRASPEGEAAVRQALAEDVVVKARYRLA